MTDYTHDQNLIKNDGDISLYKTSFYYGSQCVSWIYHVVNKEKDSIYDFDDKESALKKYEQLVDLSSIDANPLFDSIHHDDFEQYNAYESIRGN